MNTNNSFNGNFKGLKLFPEEEILCVQRQHWLVLLGPSIIIGFFFLIIGSSVFSIFSFGYIWENLVLLLVILLTMALTSLLLMLAIFTFMYWYYQFYVITDKRLIHIHFFRIGGFHIDEVFHNQTNPLEIDRQPENFLFDFLGIEDIYVYFHRAERPEPFIFKMPRDPNSIEEILEECCMIEKE